ncbi:hypothetical protein MoryE10_14000 [Methylogaea oryzae]|uniref:Uncharacterized protein n=1 Tax=Methylogaea oryzae TaxID=1295382 RepID=A0A8D4VP52_9GAMM|nr:hypothetical protein MoryE10_14000 [Methylogaea oryzae]
MSATTADEGAAAGFCAGRTGGALDAPAGGLGGFTSGAGWAGGTGAVLVHPANSAASNPTTAARRTQTAPPPRTAMP